MDAVPLAVTLNHEFHPGPRAGIELATERGQVERHLYEAAVVVEPHIATQVQAAAALVGLAREGGVRETAHDPIGDRFPACAEA